MNTAVVAKSAGGVVVVGTGSGYGGYVIYDRYTTTIKDTLKDSSFLNTTKTESGSSNPDDSKWEVLIRSYWDADSKKKIEGLDLTKPDSGDDVSNDHKNKIKEKCKELLDRAIGFEDLTLIQQQVKDWCTEIQNLKEALDREEKNVIKDDDESGWKKVVETYKSDNDLKTFLAKDSDGNDLDKDSVWSELKGKCTTFLSQTSTKENLEKIKKYCVKNQAS